MNAEQDNSQPEPDSPSRAMDDLPQATEPENGAPPQGPSQRPGIPTWTLGLLVLALTAALVWAGNAYIQSRQRPPGQTPLPAPSATTAPTAMAASTATPLPTAAELEPAEPEGALILVADLYSGGSDPDADLTQRFYETLVARIEENDLQSQLRVERLDETMADDAAARAVGRAQNAGYVLWSTDAESGKETSLTRIETQTRARTTSQGRDLVLSAPDQHDLQPWIQPETAVARAADYVLFVWAYDRLDLEAAQRFWNQALDATPEIEDPTFDAQVHLYQGNLYAWEEDDDAALAEYNAALESAPDSVLAYVNRGIVRYAQGDDAAALEDLDQALELDPGLANAYYARATVYRGQEQVEKAMEDLDRALELDPQHAPALASRGLLNHNEGDHEAALNDYTRALELDPEASEVYLNRGGTYATLGQFEAALDDYTRAIELAPDDADAYYNRGTVQAMLSAYGQALADLDRALELKPDFAQVYGNRGLVYKAMGDTEKAIADLEHFLEMSDNPEWREMIEQQLAELKQE